MLQPLFWRGVWSWKNNFFISEERKREINAKRKKFGLIARFLHALFYSVTVIHTHCVVLGISQIEVILYSVFLFLPCCCCCSSSSSTCGFVLLLLHLSMYKEAVMWHELLFLKNPEPNWCGEVAKCCSQSIGKWFFLGASFSLFLVRTSHQVLVVFMP